MALLLHVQFTLANKLPFVADRYLWQWESGPSFHFSRLPLPPSREYLPFPLECCDFGVRFADWCTMRGVRIAAGIKEYMVTLASDAPSEFSPSVDLLVLLVAQLSSHADALRSTAGVGATSSDAEINPASLLPLSLSSSPKSHALQQMPQQTRSSSAGFEARISTEVESTTDRVCIT